MTLDKKQLPWFIVNFASFLGVIGLRQEMLDFDFELPMWLTWVQLLLLIIGLLALFATPSKGAK